MKFKTLKFQEGGAMPPQEAPTGAPGAEQAPGGAPAEGGAESGDPLQQLVQMSMQALQSQDCQAAMAVCQAFVQLAQQQGGGAEQQPEPQGEPVYKKGGKLVRLIKK